MIDACLWSFLINPFNRCSKPIILSDYVDEGYFTILFSEKDSLVTFLLIIESLGVNRHSIHVHEEGLGANTFNYNISLLLTSYKALIN
jgi:hypothetical protein